MMIKLDLVIFKYFTFTPVFHRILDFKTGLDFYPAPVILNQP